MAKDETVDGHDFEQAPGVSDGQGGLMCQALCPWRCKELDTTERLNRTELGLSFSIHRTQMMIKGLPHMTVYDLVDRRRGSGKKASSGKTHVAPPGGERGGQKLTTGGLQVRNAATVGER